MPPTPTPWLTDRLCALARAASAPAPPAGECVPPPRPAVLADRPDGTVVAVGDIVAKAHPPASSPSDADDLEVQLRIASHPLLRGVMLPPLLPGAPAGPDTADGTGPGSEGAHGARSRALPPLRLYGGRPATLWPRGRPVDPDDPEAAPWEAAGTLLARLHRVPVEALRAELPRPVPPMRGPRKAALAMRRMRTALDGGVAPTPALTAAAEAAEGAWALLPAWCRAEAQPGPAHPEALCHGDFHLGQLVRHPADGGTWQLIDVDDLGAGDPAWDLARPAAWFATGLLPAEDWQRFLHAYEAAGGPSPPAEAGADWPPRLDAPARALAVQTTATAVAKAHAAQRPLDEAETACAEACARMTAAPAGGQRDETGRRLETQ